MAKHSFICMIAGGRCEITAVLLGTQVLGALASVLSIWLVTGILVYEAVYRIFNPVHVNGKREALCCWHCAQPRC